MVSWVQLEKPLQPSAHCCKRRLAHEPARGSYDRGKARSAFVRRRVCSSDQARALSRGQDDASSLGRVPASNCAVGALRRNDSVWGID